MRKFFLKIWNRTILKWRIARRRKAIEEGDIVVPGAIVLEMLETVRRSRSEAQRYDRKPDADRLDGEAKILTWLLKTYGGSKD